MDFNPNKTNTLPLENFKQIKTFENIPLLYGNNDLLIGYIQTTVSNFSCKLKLVHVCNSVGIKFIFNEL